MLFVWGKVNQLCSHLQAEAQALLWAVHLAIQNHWYLVMFKGDSKICFDALNHPDQTSNWSVDTFICNIRSLSSCFSSCSFGWACTNSNSIANVAARFVLNCMQPFCFSEGMLPLPLRQFVREIPPLAFLRKFFEWICGLSKKKKKEFALSNTLL